MRNLIILIFLSLSFNLWGACDAPISRTNNSANAVLTSTKYNADLNTVYTAANTVDGSCLTDGSVTTTKLDTTSLAVLLKTVHTGCKVVYSDANTVNVEKCLLAINGNFVETTTNTSVTWGCTGCSSQAASTTYYVYAVSTSTGSTLTLKILTTAPGSNGFNGDDRVLGRFYNDAAQDIDSYSIDQWSVNKWNTQSTDWVNAGAVTIEGSTTDPTKATTVDTDYFRWKRSGDGKSMVVQWAYFAVVNTGAANGSGSYFLTIPGGRTMPSWVEVDSSTNNLLYGTTLGVCKVNGAGAQHLGVGHAYSLLAFGISNTLGGKVGSASFAMNNASISYRCQLRIPIEGWLGSDE